MSTAYADVSIGKAALGHLKGVAAKWKKKQLSLPAFLGVAAAASHEEWKERLAEVSRRWRNQGAKPGHREAVDLCTFLETHFRDERKWRGLLNQVGRLHIEVRVEQLAEGSSPADVLRLSVKVIAHEAAAFAGAPDAEAVVRDLFKEKGLEVPAAEADAKSKGADEDDDGDDDQSPAESDTGPASSSGEPGNGDGGASVWATLGNLFLNGAVEALKARAEVARHQIAADVEAFKQTPNVAGNWWGEQGARLSFSQRGVQVQVQGQAMNQAVSGDGVIRGRHLELHVWMMPQQVRLSVLLDVTPDGGMMRGTARDDSGRTTAVNLRR